MTNPNKPYLIISLVGDSIGAVYERKTYDEALDKAVELCKQQGDATEEEIREELTQDGNYIGVKGSVNGNGWSVEITQTENE